MITFINFFLSLFPTWFGILLLTIIVLFLLILLIRVIAGILDAIPFL